MQPEKRNLVQNLARIRQNSGFEQSDVEIALVLGPGWLARFEDGSVEPSLGTIGALLNLYGATFEQLVEGVHVDSGAKIDRHLMITETGHGIQLHFPMGKFKSVVPIEGATQVEAEEALRVLRNALAAGDKSDGITTCFLEAQRSWPNVNPSDLWYFFVAHAYQDDYNHPAEAAGTDWAQSWKRASGWSLERVLVSHYESQLDPVGIRMVMPTDPEVKREYMRQMGVAGADGAEKADVILLGKREGTWEPFGVVHVKASFAERRTDDVPLSKELISRGYASPLLTMDAKASPSASPANRGELGAVQGGTERVSSKRLDFEQDRKFDACFSYNLNTVPTPAGSNVAARILRASFKPDGDTFAPYLKRKWAERQGF